MKLKRIELAGFKSFADRTTFDMSEGTTCFVGPNGCGKSNLVDALKWALGEQKPTSLRGDAMIDVIFKGNQSRPAAPYSEVMLTFSNENRELPIDGDDIVVSRKLHRSGESEYQLNGAMCRLKDIKTLLMDTGVGLTAYSFMEQGRIDALLSSSAVERRAVFEEAAGTSKYRLRRQETLRKLERVEQDLLRAGDIIAELERQSRSLKQQAGRANSYKAYSERLRELLGTHVYHEHQRLLAERTELLNECNARAEVEAALKAKVSELEDRTREAEENEARLTEELGHKRSAMADRKARGEAAERRIVDLGARQRELEQATAEAAEREQAIRQSVLAKEAERATLSDSLAEQRARDKEHTTELLEVRSREEALETELRSARDRMTPLLREQAALGDRLERQKRQAFEVETALGNFAKQRRSALAKQQDHAAAIAARAAELSVLRAEQRELTQRSQALQSELEERRRALAAAEGEGAALEQRATRLATELHALESRQEVLENAIRGFEGVDEGVRLLLDVKKSGAASPRIRGLLADLITVDLEHSRAVEAALGPLAQAVLVDRQDDAREALEILKARGVGRVTFLPLCELLSITQRLGVLEPTHGVRLIDAVRFDPSFWPLFERLLGDVALVDPADLWQAVMIGSRPARRVTLQGDLATPRGVVEGGGRKNGAGMIARRSELGELDARIARTRAELAELQAKAEVAGQQVSALRQAIEALAPSADEVAGKLAGVERSARAGAERAAMIRGELRVGLLESLALERDRGELLGRRTEIAQEQERIDAALARNAAEHARLEEDVRRLAEARPAMREERARLELELARLRERLSALGKQLQALENGLDENRAELRRLEKQTQEFALRQEGAREEQEQLGQSLLALQEERARLAQEIAQAQTAQESVRALLQTVRAESHAERERFTEVVEEGREVQLREQKNGLLLKGLEERSIAELGVALAMLPAPAAELPEAVDWSAVEAEILDLKGKMQRLGAVNMEAIDELGQIDERLTFMTKERDDLVKAQRSLKDMIAEMDQESRTRFQNTFEEVRKHFQVIFRQLFRGGHADLMLSEGEDVLEAGVEVIAAPPGKKPQTITLLSGGERTLTAVGLLFALFKMKPSPICVLDEVDAALDESNIERFCSMLSDYEASTQFLIVTHSKRTMSRAEVLYGVTMEGDGISRPIAIRLKEYQEKVA